MMNSKRVVVDIEEEQKEEEEERMMRINNIEEVEEEVGTGAAKGKLAKYRGVRKRKWGKWVSEIRLPNSRERIWLGSYDSPEKAARAFDAALFCLRGNLANFNFPHQPPNIPGATHLHPSQIQQVAARYASSSSFSSSSSSSSSSLHHQHHHHHHHHHHHSSMQTSSSSSSMDVISSSCTFLIDDDDYNNNFNNIPDFEIFPGFDDYFMPLHLTSLTTDDHYLEEAAYDSQDPCHLWSF